MFRQVIVAVALAALQGCGSGESVLEPPPAQPPPPPEQIDGTLVLGAGIISPYKVLPWQGDPSRLLVVTGKGESFGESMLHALDSATLDEIDAPLALGRNASAAVWVGDRVLVATRSSGELFLVDPQRWEVVASVELGIAAVGLTATGETTAAVSSVAEDRSVILVSVANDALEILAERSLPEFARTLAYDAASDRLYAAGPLLGIETLNATTLASVAHKAVGGALGFAAVVLDGNLLVTDRDGFVHVMDLQSQDVTTVDLAGMLGLNPLDVPLRGIDPLDIIVLDNDRLAVLNQRQNSLIFRFVPGAAAPLEPLAELRAVGYGVWLPGRRELLWARSQADSLSRVSVPADEVGALTLRPAVVGRRIVDSVVLSGAATPLLAVLDSQRRITLVDEQGAIAQVIESDPDELWSAPLASGPDATLLTVGFAAGAPVVWQLDAAGNRLNAWPLTVTPYGLAAGGDRIIVTDRLNAQVQIIDVVDGTSEQVALTRSRPRQSVPLARNRTLVVHDTNPDIGVSVLDADLAVSFSDYSLSRWWSDVIPQEDGAVAVTFAGSIGFFDQNGQASDSVLVNFPGVIKAAPSANDGVWLVSQDLSSAILVDVGGRAVPNRLNYPDLIRLHEIDTGRVWLVGLRDLQSVNYLR